MCLLEMSVSYTADAAVTQNSINDDGSDRCDVIQRYVFPQAAYAKVLQVFPAFQVSSTIQSLLIVRFPRSVTKVCNRALDTAIQPLLDQADEMIITPNLTSLTAVPRFLQMKIQILKHG